MLFLDTIAGTAGGSFTVTIPNSIPASSGYRLRVISTIPVIHSDTSCNQSIIVNDCTAIEESADNKVFIYPNPANNEIYVTIQKDLVHQIQIIDMLGETVFKQNVIDESSRIDVGFLEQGIYFVKIGSSTDETTCKLIISR